MPPIRPPKENIHEVINANATFGFLGKAGFVDIKHLNGGANMSQPTEKARVENLIARITSDEGYFERIIIDGLGNVVEGQHRFSAATLMKWTAIPVQQIIDPQDHVDPKVETMVVDASGLSENRAWEVIRNVTQEWYEDGDDGEGDYTNMGPAWAPPFNAALKGLREQNGLRNLVEVKQVLSESEQPVDVRQMILSSKFCKHGIKVAPSAKLWRGQAETGGTGTASYGQGYYFTCDRSYAAQFGKVSEVSRIWLPDNALRFETTNDFQIWVHDAIKLLGYPSKTEFTKDYPDFRDFIKYLDPEIDGIQMWKGKDAIFVTYS